MIRKGYLLRKEWDPILNGYGSYHYYDYVSKIGVVPPLVKPDLHTPISSADF